MDNKSFISRICAKTGLTAARAAELTSSLAALMAEHCGALDTVAIPQLGNFTGVKHDETVETAPDGSRTLCPPKIEISFTPGAMLSKIAGK